MTANSCRIEALGVLVPLIIVVGAKVGSEEVVDAKVGSPKETDEGIAVGSGVSVSSPVATGEGIILGTRVTKAKGDGDAVPHLILTKASHSVPSFHFHQLYSENLAQMALVYRLIMLKALR